MVGVKPNSNPAPRIRQFHNTDPKTEGSARIHRKHSDHDGDMEAQENKLSTARWMRLVNKYCIAIVEGQGR